ncbi:MAG: hypothetical protein U0704_00080 [Candidatus Eisenbacteria bacterium]
MSDDSLFRREAVEEYLRGREHGALVAISPAWSVWAFGLLVASFAAAAAFVAFAPMAVEVSGPARVVSGGAAGEVRCALPAEALATLRPGQAVALDFGAASRAAVALRVTAVEPQARGAAEAAAEFGPLAAPVAIVRAAGALPAGAAPGTPAVVHVRVGTRSLWRELRLGAEPR